MTIQEFYEWAVAHGYEHFHLISCADDCSEVEPDGMWVEERWQQVLV